MKKYKRVNIEIICFNNSDILDVSLDGDGFVITYPKDKEGWYEI